MESDIKKIKENSIMFNMKFKKVSTLLKAISMILLVSCSSENSSCQLDSMVDDYQILADKLKNSIDSNDFNSIMSVNQDVADWLKKWEGTTGNAADNCSLNEIIDATNRMLAIAESLMK